MIEVAGTLTGTATNAPKFKGRSGSRTTPQVVSACSLGVTPAARSPLGNNRGAWIGGDGGQVPRLTADIDPTTYVVQAAGRGARHPLQPRAADPLPSCGGACVTAALERRDRRSCRRCRTRPRNGSRPAMIECTLIGRSGCSAPAAQVLGCDRASP
jgi:hypothetical protein